MRYTVRTLGRAEKDITEIYNYIAEELQNPLAAKKLVNRFRAKIESLDVMPERGRLYGKYYSAKVAKYRIIYSINKTKAIVSVLRVLYAGRNLAKILE